MAQIHWEIASTGNSIVKEGGDQVLCTVYQKPRGIWRVVVNVDVPYGGRQPHFSDKVFTDEHSAKTHAEELLAIRDQLEPTPLSKLRNTFTDWHLQKSKSNGKPTYGRRTGPVNLSVKCSARGSWYFMPYGHEVKSKVVGWFPTAEAAMAAADQKYR